MRTAAEVEQTSAGDSVPPPRRRTGGQVVIETLTALGVRTVFGVPGQHALGLFEPLRQSNIALVGGRTEFNAVFSAEGYATITGAPAVVFVPAGPGALLGLSALQDALLSSVPIVVIVGSVPLSGLGGSRYGHLHELADQQLSAANVTKSRTVVRSVAQISDAIRDAFGCALTAPCGPVWIEIPQDVILAPADIPVGASLDTPRRPITTDPAVVDHVVELLDRATAPVIYAGGGVVRAGARAELIELAERLRAPVATTFAGKSAFPWNHPLSAQSWQEDSYMRDLLESTDLLLVLGTGLGQLSSHYFTLQPPGTIIQIDADLGKIGSRYDVVGVRADLKTALAALIEGIQPRKANGKAEATVHDTLRKIRIRIDGEHRELELSVLGQVRRALPPAAPSFWDMTILTYWAWSAWDPKDGLFQSAQGAGGLGYALPTALGAAAARGGSEPVLAVTGDGGAMYGLPELAVLAQHQLPVTWLIIDDGGYGILREYMMDAFGVAVGTELHRPDFVELARSFGLDAVHTDQDHLEADLRDSFTSGRPRVVVLAARLSMFAPTHHRDAE